MDLAGVDDKNWAVSSRGLVEGPKEANLEDSARVVDDMLEKLVDAVTTLKLSSSSLASEARFVRLVTNTPERIAVSERRRC